jgi:hypothetical protein
MLFFLVIEVDLENVQSKYLSNFSWISGGEWAVLVEVSPWGVFHDPFSFGFEIGDYWKLILQFFSDPIFPSSSVHQL